MSELLTGMISTCVVSIVVAKFQHFEMLILHLSQSSALCLDSPDHIIFITMILSKSCQTDTPCWPELEQNYKYNHVWIMLWPCLISSLSLHPAVVQLCCVSSGPDLVCGSCSISRATRYMYASGGQQAWLGQQETWIALILDLKPNLYIDDLLLCLSLICIEFRKLRS